MERHWKVAPNSGAGAAGLSCYLLAGNSRGAAVMLLVAPPWFALSSARKARYPCRYPRKAMVTTAMVTGMVPTV